jgi:hypothetical protein
VILYPSSELAVVVELLAMDNSPTLMIRKAFDRGKVILGISLKARI